MRRRRRLFRAGCRSCSPVRVIAGQCRSRYRESRGALPAATVQSVVATAASGVTTIAARWRSLPARVRWTVTFGETSIFGSAGALTAAAWLTGNLSVDSGAGWAWTSGTL